MRLKFGIITIIAFLIFNSTYGQQPGVWVWVHGDSTNLNNGHFGTQGVTSPLNYPPPTYEPCEWRDLNGNFWLYGGLKPGCGGFCVYNDLWKYNPVIGRWTWMKGTGVPNGAPVFGVKGVAAPTNQPPPLSWGVKTWVDLNGNLWMFGGHDQYSTPTYNYYNDLWKYDISTNMWTWVKGPGIPNQPPVYGTKGVPDILNNPDKSAESAMSWTSNSGDLFQMEQNTNVLWKYNIATNMWTWVKGSPFPSALQTGSLQVEDSSNNPLSGELFSKWKDLNGNFWFFDNDGLMWRYNVTTNNWTWMSGDTSLIGQCYRHYGDRCVESPMNTPGARHENRAAWTDKNGNFWMYGGFALGCGALSDLWMYNVSSNQWKWVDGDSAIITSPNSYYGTFGVPDPLNNPGHKQGAVGWYNQNATLYLFGGTGLGYSWYSGALWQYTIDTLCLTGLNEPEDALFQINLYPNPSYSFIEISVEAKSDQKIELSICNVLGEVLVTYIQERPSKRFDQKVDLENYSKGTYFVQVKCNDRIVNKKFIKL